MKAKGSVRTGDAQRSRRWVRVLQRPGAMPNGSAPRPRARRSPSGTGRSATRLRTTRTVSTSKPRRARRSSSPRRCGRPIPSIQLIAWGDSGWAARMREVAGRAHAHAGVPPHVQSRRREAAGAARRAVPPRRGGDVATADERLEDQRRARSARSATAWAAPDAAGDDRVPFHRSPGAIAAT